MNDDWAPFSSRWILCTSGLHRSPDLEDPWEAVTWSEDHDRDCKIAERKDAA